ncbi:protoheme IX farnesyltransferase [Methylopila jiangsuensis]|uniref:Protoheme IX farnesyltransferase n=1 Tax=Methylopila jiangsuensis TaxID=586230 RepID=A0A9W6N456_9HYPH|nr:protoheme IX farnesyltransferase [Methylopila jiangsuensis]GLK76931.1 protoheme IX farnesyltransferase [Methylopila jiangsuensis]
MTFAHDDTAAHTAVPAMPGPSLAGVEDYIALLKPRVMSLVVFSALVGMVAAPSGLHPVLAAIALLCIAVGAGASGALNMWWDADIDAVMTRTANRPVPAGRMTPGEACAFGVVLSVGSVLMLGLASNWLAAGLLAFTIFFYVVIYTMWLKRWTPQNIVIGGLAGAMPPMVGWAAVSGEVSLHSALLVAIIFMWTPPHFWALALIKSDDYARAGVPMLPCVAGPDETRRQILLYALALAPLGVAPALVGLGGWLYLALSSVLGLGFVLRAVAVYRRREGEAARKAAGGLFGFSLIYLFALLAVVLVEKLAGLPPLPSLLPGWM